VEKYIMDNFRQSFSEAAQAAKFDIQKSLMWSELKAQFSSEELKLFLYHWGRIVGQFKDDVFPTEGLQIVDAIKLELLMSRALRNQQKSMEDILFLEEQLEKERNLDEEERDTDRITNLERQIGVLRASQDSLSTQFKDMLDKKTKIFREMKATRDQRIKILEQGKESYISWLKKIMTDAELKDRLGKDMEKMRLAADAEFGRLSGYHEYIDGSVDQPMLTPENVLED
jgi:hypothetical protein